jgi:rubrerythrin
MKEKYFQETIHLAVEKKKMSFNFYIRASQTTRFRRTQNMFLKLAEDEEGHQKLLRDISKDKTAYLGFSENFNPKALDFFDDLEVSLDMSYADILRAGIKLEEYSLNFYQVLDSASKDKKLKKIFNTLAQGALEHKRLLEEQDFNK